MHICGLNTSPRYEPCGLPRRSGRPLPVLACPHRRDSPRRPIATLFLTCGEPVSLRLRSPSKPAAQPRKLMHQNGNGGIAQVAVDQAEVHVRDSGA